MNAKNSSNTESHSKKTYFDDQPESRNANEKSKIEFYDSGVSEDDIPIATSLENKTPFQVPDDSDSDDGILKVKRKDHDIELPSDNELEMNISTKIRKKKVVTKAAAAKKLLKKKIVPNKKIIFDEEGEAVIQATKEKRSELAQEYEKEDEGGIDIEKAKKVLREEDKFDKQLFKEKVKAKHKEEKKKLKEKRKAEQAEKDEFGTDSEGEEPDLSWLPDPDKIYGKKESEDEDEKDQNINDKADEDTHSNRLTDDDEQFLPPTNISSHK